MSSSGNQSLLFVLGMHRSGTSALCAALAACGASFGSHLIDAMAGVNDEGFWEDAGVVAVNEQLLAMADSSWFAPAPNLADTDWVGAYFDPLREQARQLLRDGFGDSPRLQAVKDPRLCLTLPFWLSLCAELGIAPRVCVINRRPLEVARSLEKRDGFPLGYGLRLYASYRACIDRFVPADALFVHYDALLQDVSSVIAGLATVLPLRADPTELSTAVRVDLRHQKAGDEDDLLPQADAGKLDPAALACAIETRYPLDETLREFSRRFTARGAELARIGQQHSVALATIDERDEQIREFDLRLSKLGDEHSHALQVLRERDAELASIKRWWETVGKIPGVGYLIRLVR